MGAVSRQPVVGVGSGGRFPCRLVLSVLRQTPALIESPFRGSGPGESGSNPSALTNFQTDVNTANCHEDEPLVY
jgi:hypothetical protein